MANAFVKAEQVIRQALGLLEREIVLPALVWRDAVTDFRGAKNDTVSIRVPAYTAARTRTMRSGTGITVDDLDETKVDVTLDTHVYKAVGISDEEMTLDIVSFGEQVTRPIVQAVARKAEDSVATEMADATYANEAIEIDNTDPYDSFVDARNLLNKANVPMAGRFLVLGSDVEAKTLKSDHLARFDGSGSDTALREAQIGRIAGFTAVTSNAIDPDIAIAGHKSAFTLAMVTPEVPQGATWGASETFAGMTMRLLRDYDFDNVRDRLLADLFLGTGTVLDEGYFDSEGRFQPREDTIGSSITLAISAAADDIIDTTTDHGYAAGDRVVFTSLTGGAGLSTNREYYVIAASLAATTFKVSQTLGGSAVNFTTDITAGAVRSDGASLLVRAVKLVDNS